MTRTAFADRHRDRLSAWLKQLSDSEGTVVAVSRKAPRLIELGVRENLVDRSLLERVTTEFALPFIKHPPVAFTVADDVVIFGTTLTGVVTAATDMFPGVPVSAAPLLGSYPPILSERGNARTAKGGVGEATPFVDAEVGAFALLDKPYDIEHPVVYCDLAALETPEQISIALGELGARFGCQVYETPRRLITREGHEEIHHAWTYLAPVTETEHDRAQFRKLRCYLDLPRRRVAMTAISPRTGTVAELASSAAALPKPLGGIWAHVSQVARADPNDLDDRRRRRSLVALANWLLELDELRATIDDVALHLGMSLGGVSPLFVSQFDLGLLMGPEWSAEFQPEVNSWLRQAPIAHQLEFHVGASIGPRPDSTIPREFRRSHDDDLTTFLADPRSHQEVLNAELKALQVGVELPSRELWRTDPYRLDFGVHLRYLEHLVEQQIPFSYGLLHRALDSLIDSGAAVPRYLPDRIGQEEVWFRAFRAGEAEPDIKPDFVIRAMAALSEATHLALLPEVVTEKYFVLLVDHLGWFLTPEYSLTTAVFRDWHLLGARPAINTSGGREWLMDWAQRKRIVRRIEVRQGTGVSRKYTPLYPPGSHFWPHSTMTPETLTKLEHVAVWVGEAHQANGLGTGFLTAIASLESDWAYEQSMLAELDGWLHHPNGAPYVINILGRVASGESTLADSDTTLRFLASWTAQAGEKKQLRAKMPGYLAEADKLWPRSSQGPASDVWAELQDVVRSRALLRGTNTSGVEQLTVVAGRFTSLLRNVLSAWGFDDPRAVPVSKSAEKLSKTLHGSSQFRPEEVTEIDGLLAGITADADRTQVVECLRITAALLGNVIGSAVRGRSVRLLVLDRAFVASFRSVMHQKPVQRGFAFEDWLNDLFQIHGVAVRSQFVRATENGTRLEQVDGAIQIDFRLFLVEAKWRQDPLSKDDIANHLLGVEQRAEVGGIVIAVNGFEKSAIEAARDLLARRIEILVTVDELLAVIESGQDLSEYLRYRVRRAQLDRDPCAP